MPERRPLPTFHPQSFDIPPARPATGADIERPQYRALPNDRRQQNRFRQHEIQQRLSAIRARLPPMTTPRRRPRSPATELPSYNTLLDSVEGRQNKRRRIQSDSTSSPHLQTIKYGYYGQVVPGQLKMELVSCDGGEFQDPRHPSLYLGPKNVLKHDKSVYCSQVPGCSILLRHADDSPFTLEKLHVVGPEHGFTAPVREGIAYVAMNLNDLNRYMDPPPHARLRGVHTPPHRHQHRRRAQQLTWDEALREMESEFSADESEQEDPEDLPQDSYYGENYNFNSDGVRNPAVRVQDAADLSRSNATTYFPVILTCDEDLGPEQTTQPAVAEFRLQRLHYMRRHPAITTSWERESRYQHQRAEQRDRDRDNTTSMRNLHTLMARSRVADPPSQRPDDVGTNRPQGTFDTLFNDQSHEFGMDEEWGSTVMFPVRDPSDPPSQVSNRRVPAKEVRAECLSSGAPDECEVTRARFEIPRDKNRITIKFDPPVSGRFVMLKLWAGKRNVDVQSVLVEGYGEGRFFPAVEYR